MSEEDTSKVALVGLGMVSGTYVDALKNMGGQCRSYRRR